jgi:hypothetical protein
MLGAIRQPDSKTLKMPKPKANAAGASTYNAVPAELEMSRALETVPLHPKRQVTYQKKHDFVLQDLPETDRRRQAELLKKIPKGGFKDDPVAQIALEVLKLNQLGLVHFKEEMDRQLKTAFCQSVGCCPPKSCQACITVYLGGIESLGCIWCCLGYYKCCKSRVHTQKKLTYAEVKVEPLPKLYLVDVAILKNLEGDSMPSFETLKERDLLSAYNFDRCPVFTFVSHKWIGNSPDDSNHFLFNEIKTKMTGYVWVDYMCVPQAGAFDVRLPFLSSIPYVIIASSTVWTPNKGNDYRRSVWCNMEQFLEMDEGLALVEEFRIQKPEDLVPIILGLKEVCLLLLIHSQQYQELVTKSLRDEKLGSTQSCCHPIGFGARDFLVFHRPELHMLNPTLARICEFYLIHKLSPT